ncbi:MAG: hypothetical protein A4E68_01816 [Syntrophaceae bacterium PtaB.Bin095]|nr:MAG: hypothetical protein A4E68_01816 [Syntrophaceae bacterium PtaB.Bin095]
MKPSAKKVWIHQVALCMALAVSGLTPMKAFEMAQPAKDQTSQGVCRQVTLIRSASMMKPVMMMPARSSRTMASSGVLSGSPL